MALDIPKRPVNLQALLGPRPRSTVLLRVSGSSMRDAGIACGDLARLANGFTLKQLAHTSGGLELQPANPAFPALPLRPDGELQLWGVALQVIRSLGRAAAPPSC